METKEYNSFKFFRTYFNIPKRIKLEWCVVKEYTEQEGVKLRLGIALNERLYIDVASRRFFTCLDAPCLQRTIYPADRINEGKTTVINLEIIFFQWFCPSILLKIFTVRLGLMLLLWRRNGYIENNKGTVNYKA